MSPLVEDLIDLLLRRGWVEVFPLVIVAIVRPLGLLYGCSFFSWGLGSAGFLRTIIALWLGLPILAAHLDTFEALLVGDGVARLAWIVLIEFAIGLCIGLIASLPFFALQYAGAITDQFRGESDSGLHSPTGGQITTFGNLYIVVLILVFIQSDGISHLIRWLYESSVAIPLAAGLPAINGDALSFVVTAFRDSLELAVRVALPLLVVLGVVEALVSIGARLAQRYSVYNLAFASKNLAAIALLPFLVMYVWQFSDEAIVPFFLDQSVPKAFGP